MKIHQFLIAVGAFLFALQARADQVVVNFKGTVTATQLDGVWDADLGPINPGSLIDYSITFNTTPTLVGARFAQYLNSITAFGGVVGSYYFGGRTGRVALLNDTLSNGVVADLFGLRHDKVSPYTVGRNDFGYDGGAIANYPLQQVSVYASESTTSWFSAVDLTVAPFLALQNSPALLSTLDFSMYFLPGSTGTVNALALGKFSSVSVSAVPEPATATLLFFGVVGMGLARKKLQALNGYRKNISRVAL